MHRSTTITTDTYVVSVTSTGGRTELGVTETYSAARVRAELHAERMAERMAEHLGALTTVECDDDFHPCYANGQHATYRLFLVGGGMDDSLT